MGKLITKEDGYEIRLGQKNPSMNIGCIIVRYVLPIPGYPHTALILPSRNARRIDKRFSVIVTGLSMTPKFSSEVSAV